MAAKTITVKSARSDDRVAFWERHPDHPEGEIFVAGDREVEAAETPGVQVAIREKRLVEVKKSSSSKSSSK